MFLLASSGLVSLCWVCKKVPLGMKKTMKSCQTDQQLSPFWKLGAIHLLNSVSRSQCLKTNKKVSFHIISYHFNIEISINSNASKTEEILLLYYETFLVIFKHCVLFKNRGCHSQNHKGDEGLPKGVVTFLSLNMMIEIFTKTLGSGRPFLLSKKEIDPYFFQAQNQSHLDNVWSDIKVLMKGYDEFTWRCKSVPGQQLLLCAKERNSKNFYFGTQGYIHSRVLHTKLLLGAFLVKFAIKSFFFNKL